MIHFNTLTMVNIDHILLFKTDISTDADRQTLQPVLDNLAGIRQWSVDLNDCDCVLRIESETINHQQVINLITNHGFQCRELE